MAELEIDQSHLPRVQEVRQCFAVLEDGVLAHNLQEQEIEQYYTTNIQKNQLVQNDIQIAKRLQDEEEEQQAQQSALLRQTSRQIEEQDLEYARVIQEEIQRNAEEAQRREQDDEEMAKRIQEEEEQRVRRRSRGYERHHHQGNISNSAQLSPLQHTLNRLHRGQEQFSSATSRWQCSTSHSQLTGPQSDSLREEAAQENTTSWSSQGQTDYIRQIRNELRESSSENSDDSDTVFPVQRSVWPCRLNKRVNAAPSRQWTSLHQQPERHRSFPPHSALTDEYRCFEEREQWDGEDYDDLHKRPRNPDKGRMHRDDYEGWHRSRDQDADSRLYMRKRQPSHSESVRLHDRNKQSNRGLARTWSYRDDPDKHVHFEEDTRSSYQHQNENSQVWAMLGHILRDRGVPVSFGDNGAPLQITPQRRDSQVLHGSEVSCSDSQPHQRVFQRATTTRHSFHGDIRERRRLSYRENSGRDHREERDRHHDNGEVDEISSRVPDLTNRERRGSRWWKEQRCTTKDDIGERNANSYRVRRTKSEHWHRTTEERLSSEEEQERRVERPHRRATQRSQSLSSSRVSTRNRSRHMAAGVSLIREQNESDLDLVELQQVLEDEELARKLQGEELLLRRSSHPSPHHPYPEGDFRVAQVAQDEEIARFMQKQEFKSKGRSRELEGPESWREHKAMISHHDRRATTERQVQQERLDSDSEGLSSPTEDYSPETLPPSPTIPQTQQIRNIAEELDPTFQARRQMTESSQLGQTGVDYRRRPVVCSASQDIITEEPTFIPPTKRQNQSDKSGRSKSKEKKENCKQQ